MPTIYGKVRLVGASEAHPGADAEGTRPLAVDESGNLYVRFVDGTASLPASATADLSQAAGSYDLLTAAGDVVIESVAFLVTTPGATFTSVAVKTDDASPLTLLSAANGAVANLTNGATLVPYVGPAILRSGKKIRYTIVGATGTGALRVVVIYRPLTTALLA